MAGMDRCRKAQDSVSLRAVSSLLAYDSGSGIITSKVFHGKWIPGRCVGTLSGGYLSIQVLGKVYRSHRLAWFLYYGKWPEKFIDHINGNRSDNRIKNLREVTNSENMQNCTAARVSSSTGVLGVSPSRGQFTAAITVAGKVKNLGRYPTMAEAEQAYLSAKLRLHIQTVRGVHNASI